MLALTSDLMTHVDMIDRQHIVLFERINAVIAMGGCAACESETESTPRLLAAYTDKHFSDEEELMGQCGYGYIDWHKEMHRWYVAEIAKLQSEYAANGPTETYGKLLENSIVNWIVKHILTVDMVLAKHIHMRALKEESAHTLETPPASAAPTETAAPPAVTTASANGEPSSANAVPHEIPTAGIGVETQFKTKTFGIAVADDQLGFVACALVFHKDKRAVHRSD